MKSLLLVSHKMNLGGTEKALLTLLESLKKEPVKITLLLLEKGGLLEKEIPSFVEVRYLEDFEEIKPLIFNPPLQTIQNLIQQRKLVQAFRHSLTYFKVKLTGNWHYFYTSAIKRKKNLGVYDIAVAFAGPSDFISYLILEKVNAKKKIQWIHFDIEKVISNFSFGKKFYPKFDHIFCVSNSAKEIFLKHFPELQNKTEVFENIINRKAILQQANEGESFQDNYSGIRILTVGRFTHEKGQQLIPEVAAQLKADGVDFRWYLVGDGRQRKAVEALVKERGLENNVIFLGKQMNPYPFMKNCDIYVQPSLHEGCPLTVAEAKVFCKPMVLTNFASAKDLIVHGETGLIAEISSESIYFAVKDLVDHPEKRSKFSTNKMKPEAAININKLLNIS